MPSNPTEYAKAYYSKHKERLAKLQSKSAMCEVCNCEIKQKNIKRHQTSKKHLTNMIKQTIETGKDEIELPMLNDNLRKFVIKYVGEVYGEQD